MRRMQWLGYLGSIRDFPLLQEYSQHLHSNRTTLAGCGSRVVLFWSLLIPYQLRDHTTLLDISRVSLLAAFLPVSRPAFSCRPVLADRANREERSEGESVCALSDRPALSGSLTTNGSEPRKKVKSGRDWLLRIACCCYAKTVRGVPGGRDRGNCLSRKGGGGLPLSGIV